MDDFYFHTQFKVKKEELGDETQSVLYRASISQVPQPTFGTFGTFKSDGTLSSSYHLYFPPSTFELEVKGGSEVIRIPATLEVENSLN